MADLTTLSNVRAWLATDGMALPATDDALLTRLITAVSRFMEAVIGQAIAPAAYTWKGGGTGSARLLLPNTPVTAVSSLSIDGKAGAASPGYGQAGYSFDRLGLYLGAGAVFPRGVQNVSVAYTAGFASVPADLEQACISTVALRYKERDRVGYASKSIGGETVAFTIRDFPPDALTSLRNYVKVVPL